MNESRELTHQIGSQAQVAKFLRHRKTKTSFGVLAVAVAILAL